MTPFRVSLVLGLICLVAAWQVTLIPESAIQMTVGPTLVPAVVVGILSVASLLYGISAWRGRQVDESQAPEQQPLPGSSGRMLVLLAGGVVFMVGVPFLGFWAPGTACGMCIARSFDAPFRFRSFLICGGIAGGFWFLFARVLGVGLGPATPFGF